MMIGRRPHAAFANSTGDRQMLSIPLLNQQLVAEGDPTIGFINPVIYAQNVSGGALRPVYRPA
jgi:hypothetical protein